MKKPLLIIGLVGVIIVASLLLLGLTGAPRSTDKTDPFSIGETLTSQIEYKELGLFYFQKENEPTPPNEYAFILENGDRIPVDKETWDAYEEGDLFTYSLSDVNK